jgi:hypothetical protein
MGRIPRYNLLIDDGIYHVMSRTVRGEELDDEDKTVLAKIIHHFTLIYFTTTYSYAVMDNHFHLVVKMNTTKEYALAEIRERYERYRKNFKDVPRYDINNPKDVELLREKWKKLSNLLKDIKQTFSVYYNKRYGRNGYLWRERFKSVLLEKGDALLNCMVYVDLNPIRANLVPRPEEYAWCSFHYHIAWENAGDWLSLDFFTTESAKRSLYSQADLLLLYRKILYQKGVIPKLKEKNGEIIEQGVIPKEVYDKEEKNDFALDLMDKVDQTIEQFTQGLIVGSKKFIEKIKKTKKDLRERVHGFRKLKGTKELFSLASPKRYS